LYEYIIMADDAFFTDGLVLIFLVILFLLIATWAFFKDRKAYKRTKRFNNYYPTLVAGLFVIAGFATAYILEARDNSPILLEAGYDGGFNGAWFEFREDGTYKFANSGGIGATYTRGKYQFNGNRIILDRDNLDGAVLTRFLLIRTREQDERPIKANGRRPEMLLYQVDSDDSIVDRETVFVVHEDRRKK
jgi:hypothetical protein